MIAKQSSLFEQEHSIIIRECNNSTVDKLIADNHYSHKVTPNRWKSFAVFYNGVLEGAMQLGYGIKPEEKQHIIEGANSETVKEFDRMYLTDKMPKNSESQVISLLIKYLKKNHPELKVLISYADGIRGKVGTIYQASNFVYIGEVDGEFYYIPSKNEWVHPVTMWHWHGTRAKDALLKLYPDIKHIRGPQYRYVYFIDKLWKSHLKIQPIPYPKCASSVSDSTTSNQGERSGLIPALAHHTIQTADFTNPLTRGFQEPSGSQIAVATSESPIIVKPNGGKFCRGGFRE